MSVHMIKLVVLLALGVLAFAGFLLYRAFFNCCGL